MNNSPLKDLLAAPTKKVTKKKVELKLKDKQEPKSVPEVEKLEVVPQNKALEPIKKKGSVVDKVQEVVKKTEEKILEHQDSSEVDQDDGFYDTKHTPQAEPLSLRQPSKPTKIKKKPSKLEYKPVDLITKSPALESKSIIRRQDDVVFVPLIYEAVPTLEQEEDIFDNVFIEVTEADNDDKSSVKANNVVHVDPEVDVIEFVEIASDSSGSVKQSPGVSKIELVSGDTSNINGATHPTPTLTNVGQLEEKNHRKRKIDIKDYSSSSRSIDPYFYLLKQDFPTIYRSQINQDSEHGNIIQIEPSTYHYREGKENAHLYQTLF